MSSPVLAVRVVATTAELKKALAEGKAEIVTTTAAMSKMVAAYQGDKLVQQAHNVTAALNKVGVEALTTQEAARSLATLEKAMEKLESTGRPVPAAMQATAEGLRAVVAEAQKPQQSGLSSWFSDLGTQVAATAAGMLSAQAVLGTVSTAWHAFTGFVSSSVQSAAGAEAAQSKLTAALRQQGTATPEVIAQYNALSSTMQRTTVYSDDLTTEMQALLVQVGHVMPSQMAAAQASAADLASGLGIDLEQATTLVAKAAAGHTEALGRYGITVDALDVKNRGLVAVLEKINEQFGGQAAAQAATYSGSVKQLANAWDNLKEAIGRKVTEDPVVQAGLVAITKLISNQADAVDGASTSTSHWYDQLTHVGTYIPALTGLTREYLIVSESLRKKAEQAAAEQRELAERQRATAAAAAQRAEQQAAQERQAAAEEKKHEEAAAEAKKIAAAAQERLNAETRKYNETLRSVMEASRGWVTNLDTIDGRVVEAIRHYKAQGVSVSELGQIYGLTAAQLDAVTQAFAAEAAAMEHERRVSAETTRGGEELLAMLRAKNNELERARNLTRIPALQSGPNAQLAEIKTFSASMSAMLQTDLPRNIMAAITGGGSVLRAAGSTVGGFLVSEDGFGKSLKGGLTSLLGKGLGGAVSAALPAIGALAGPLLEKLFGLGGPSQAELAGREAAAKFQQGLAAGLSDAQRAEAGGRAWAVPIIAMRDALVALGRDSAAASAEAEAAVARLYAAEREGPEAVAAVQAGIQGILDQAARVRQAASQFGPSHAELQQMAKDAKATYDYMLRSGEYTAEQLAAAFKASQEAQARSLGINVDAQQASLDMLQKGLTDLTAQRDQLWNQIAAEAPEEVMGVVEAGQRAQLATLDKQIEDQKAKLAVQAEEAATALDKALSSIEPDAVHVPVVFDYTNPPGGFTPGPLEVVPMADGGFGTVDKPTLFLAGEAGREQVAFSGGNKAFAPGALNSGMDVSKLERQMAGVERRLAQMPEMLGLALRSSLRQVRVRR